MSKEFSRRSFLKGAAATAVSAAIFGATGVSLAEEKAAVTYTPGTYTATATGMGEVTMTATFSENAITDIVLDVSNETEGIGTAAHDELVKQLLEAQSAEIDGVSGAVAVKRTKQTKSKKKKPFLVNSSTVALPIPPYAPVTTA